MCGRYYIAEEDSAAELQEILEQLNRRGAEVKTGEIYPTDTVPVLANNKAMVITPTHDYSSLLDGTTNNQRVQQILIFRQLLHIRLPALLYLYSFWLRCRFERVIRIG